MEGLIGILVWVVFIVISLARHFSKLNGTEDSQHKNIDQKIEDFFTGKQNLDSNLEKAKADKINNKVNLDKTNLQREAHERIVRESRKRDKKGKPDKARKKGNKTGEIHNTLFDDLATEKAVLKGIIFKEILGPPRAKKPYKNGPYNEQK